MARYKFRRAPRFDNLESRQLLSTAVSSSQGPSDEAQYMLQLLNLARTNPSAASQYIQSNITPDIQATLNYYGVNLSSTLQAISSATPQPPLAWNAQLAQAAQSHSQDMATNQFQSHTGTDGSSPSQRVQQAGYSGAVSTGENAYAYANSVDQAMEAFLLDWGVPDDGHRDNIQQPGVSAQNAYRDAGVGLVNANPGSTVGPLVVTQDFGSQANEQAQVVGVAFNDNQGTGSYAVGEGVGNVQITAVNTQTGQVSSTQTWASGGYELALNPGQYQLIASVNNQVIASRTITISNVNIEQDFKMTNAPVGGDLQAAVSAAQPQLSAPTPSVTAPAAPQPAQVQYTPMSVTPSPIPVPQVQYTPATATPAPISWSWVNWTAQSGND
jgi:uncharacterized protein YkwD